MELVFTKEQEALLLKIARDSAQAAIDRKKLPDFDKEAKEASLDIECGGCFTTYENHGDLRGCIGCFFPTEPLHKIVQGRAVETLEDDRFSSITSKEFKEDIDITISVLSPPKRVVDPLKEIIAGVHGVIVQKGGRSGTYLPQVATEQGWDTKKFVTHCANSKAGIRGDVLNDPSVKWQSYTATLVREKHSE